MSTEGYIKIILDSYIIGVILTKVIEAWFSNCSK